MKVTIGRATRLAGAVALACASVPVMGVGPAHAETAGIAPSAAAYFYAFGIDKPDPAPAAPPNVTGSADGVSAGNLAVASKGGSEDKISFLAFDVFSLPTGATIDKAVVRMTLVPSSPADISFNAAPGLVQACKAGTEGFLDEDGAGTALAPERLCKDFSAKATATADGKAYQWDVTALAQSWLTGSNDGIAFTRVDESSGSNFQVVFAAGKTAVLDVTYTPAVDAPVPAPAPAAPVDPGPALPPQPGGFVAAPPVDFGAGDPAADFVPTPTINTPPAPVAAPGKTQLRSVALSTSLRPDNGFWFAALGLALAVGVVSLVMGDASVQTATRRRSRLSLALAQPDRLVAVQMARHRPA